MIISIITLKEIQRTGQKTSKGKDESSKVLDQRNYDFS